MGSEKQKENVLSFAEKLKKKGFMNKIFVPFLCLSFYVIGGYSWPYVKAFGAVLKMAHQAVNKPVESETPRDNASVPEDCPNFSPVQLYIKK